MSIYNSILKILNFKDKNVIFNENFVENRKIKNKNSLVFKGYLKNDYKYCPMCGCKNNNIIVKNGTKTSLIKIPKVSELVSYLELTKQRYQCKNCKRRFTALTNIVDYRCHISNNTKLSIINYVKDILPNTLISKHHNISNMTVQRIIDKAYSSEKLYKNYLPKVICIDKFTAFKKTMAFNICDAKTGKTIDLVLDRTIDNLEKYFNYYLKEAREKVEYVVMDMYKPYLSLINKVFKNAKIIIDLFHIVQLLSRSLNKTRIKIMKKDKTNYRKYKRYWRLLFKPRLELNCSYWRKYTCFKNLIVNLNNIITNNLKIKIT